MVANGGVVRELTREVDGWGKEGTTDSGERNREKEGGN